MMEINTIYQGDCGEILKTFPDKSIDCCVTSPPYYGLRDYGAEGQVGAENTPEEYIEHLTQIFREVRRVLKDDGTLWLNLGDCYAGSNQGSGTRNLNKKQASNKGTLYMSSKEHRSKLAKIDGCKPKDLIGIPWQTAFALRADGWYLRQDIIWAKGNPMPESVRDRCTKSHEHIFLFAKSRHYYFDHEAIRESASGGAMRNKRDVWFVNTKPFKGAHFATFPDTLITPCVLAGCREGGVVLDPFIGSGTTATVAAKNNRNYIGIELNAEYIEIANKRVESVIG